MHPFVCQKKFLKKLRNIPFPVLGDDGHYLPFAEVFTSEKGNTGEYRPSYKGPTQPLPKRVKRKLPYYASVQHAKNAELMLQCSGCELWRLIFLNTN